MSARNTFAATRRSHAILKRLRRGEGVTIREVSDEFGIQYPQARADLKLLEELYDLDTYRRGRIKVWELPGAGDDKKHVGLAAALELGGVALDVFKDTPYGERIDELRENYRRGIRCEERERLDRLSRALVLRRTWSPVQNERMVEVLEDFLDAIRLRRGVAINYERSDGEIGDYLVVPRRLIWYENRLWLQAAHEGEQKLFDVAGVFEVERYEPDEFAERLVDQRLDAGVYELPEAEGEEGEPSGDQADSDDARRELIAEVGDEVDEWLDYASRDEEDAYFADAFGIFAGNFEPTTVRLVVRGSWANYLRRYRVHPSQQNEETDDGLRVTFEVGLCPEFKSFLLGMVPDVAIETPDDLRRELKERTDLWEG